MAPTGRGAAAIGTPCQLLIGHHRAQPDHGQGARSSTAACWAAVAVTGSVLLNMIHEVHNLRMLCGEIARCRPSPRTRPAASRSRTRCRSTCVLPAAHWAASCCPTPPRRRAAGSRPRRRTRPMPVTTTRTAMSSAAPTAACRCPRCASRPTPGPRTAPGGNRSTPASSGMVRDDPLKHQMAHFCAVVRGEAQPLVSARDGLANLRVTEAIAEAARQRHDGRTSPLPETHPKDHHEHPRPPRHQPQHVRQARPDAVRHRHAGRDRPAACRRSASELGASVEMLPDQPRRRDVRAHPPGLCRQGRRRADQRRRLDPLQLRHPRRAGHPDLPDRRGAHVQRPRARGVSPRVGVLRDRQRARSAASASTATCWRCAPRSRPSKPA